MSQFQYMQPYKMVIQIVLITLTNLPTTRKICITKGGLVTTLLQICITKAYAEYFATDILDARKHATAFRQTPRSRTTEVESGILGKEAHRRAKRSSTQAERPSSLARCKGCSQTVRRSTRLVQIAGARPLDARDAR
jgi:hypothetical protein